MEFICHRINKKGELIVLPKEYGVEIDLRDGLDGRIYLEHDPFKTGEDFEEYLKEYHHGILICNVKSERVELKTIKLLKKYEIENYFFLDSTFPMIKLLTDMGERRSALRYSEYEGLDTIRNMAGKVEWVWIDCFTRLPLNYEDYKKMKDMSYKLCLVSPELQGQGERIEEYKAELIKREIEVDAVCCKVDNIKRWK